MKTAMSPEVQNALLGALPAGLPVATGAALLPSLLQDESQRGNARGVLGTQLGGTLAGSALGSLPGLMTKNPHMALLGSMAGGGLGAIGSGMALDRTEGGKQLTNAFAEQNAGQEAEAAKMAMHYEAGVEDALAKLGFAPALMAAGRAAIGAAKPAAGMAARAFGLGGRQAMKSLSAAGSAGMQTLGAKAPGLMKGLQTAGNVLKHPATQVGMLGASMM